MAIEQERQEAAAATTTEAEEFASVFKQRLRVRGPRTESDIERAVEILVGGAREKASLVKDSVVETLEGFIATLDRQLTEQVNEILHAPEFQKLESAWRGLHYLVFESETDANLKIRVMNSGKKELLDNLRQFPGARWDQSPMFRQLYEEEYGQLGGEPYGALICDYEFDHEAQDVQLLRAMSKVAAGAHMPMFAAAAPSLMGLESWTELPAIRDLEKRLDTPEYAAWKSLRDAEDSRYVGLCMPRVLARLPYGASTDPVDDFAFEEQTDGHSGEKYAWMSAAYAMAVNINRAFKEYGWCTRIRGVESGGEVINLPVHTFPTDDGGVDLKCPTEIALSDRREGELSKLGLISILHRKNTDKAAFIGAQSLYRPKKMRTDDATASENLSARLPYMFAVSRFAHYLKCMLRDKIGSTKERRELQDWLNDWIRDYIDGDPENSSEATKARRPLADARVEVLEDEDNPGNYQARFFLRPHYQLEGINIGLTLVSRVNAGEQA